MVLLLWVGTLPFAAFGIPVGYLLDPDTAQPVTVVVTIACWPCSAASGSRPRT